MNRRRVAFALPLLAIVALVATAAPAAAHAWLLDASPNPSQHLPRAPDVVLLRFTEEVEDDYTRAEIVDINGTRVDKGEVQFDASRRNQILVPLEPITDGVYTVHWYTLSVDTHTAHGTFLFAVGQASLEGLPGPSQGHLHTGTHVPVWLESVGRALHYAGLTLAIGVPLFLLLVVRSPAELPPRRRRALLLTVAAGTFLGAVGSLIVLESFIQRIGLGLQEAITDTHTGTLLAYRMAFSALAALAAAALVAYPHFQRRSKYLLLAPVAFATGALIATSLSSHAAAVATAQRTAIAVDVTHLLAGSLWVGGLVAFAILGPGRHAPQLAEWVHRFSPLAMASVALILLTGIYASWIHLNAWSDFIEGGYGQSLTAKIFLLIPLIALGAYNRYYLGPRLRRGERPAKFLARSVALETTLLAAVLLAAGVLASSAPPSGGIATAAPPTELSFEKGLKTVHMIFSVSPIPPRVGIQNFTVQLHPFDAKPNPEGTQVYLKFAGPGQPEPESINIMTQATNEVWTLRGAHFTDRGAWTVYVVVQRPDEYAKTEFVIEVK